MNKPNSKIPTPFNPAKSYNCISVIFDNIMR